MRKVNGLFLSAKSKKEVNYNDKTKVLILSARGQIADKVEGLYSRETGKYYLCQQRKRYEDETDIRRPTQR